MRVLPSERSPNSGPIGTDYIAVRADLRYAGASPQASLGIRTMKPEGVASIPTELVMLAIAIILNPDVPACVEAY